MADLKKTDRYLNVFNGLHFVLKQVNCILNKLVLHVFTFLAERDDLQRIKMDKTGQTFFFLV